MSIHVDGTHFVNADGQPWFWLADTAWNVALRDDEGNWREYLQARVAQGFTVIQFVATQWRGCTRPVHGKPFDVEQGRLVIHESSFAKLDQFIEMVNAHGMAAAPVMLWAHTSVDPGQALSEAHCIELARHMVDRWRHREVIWLLAGDGDYTSEATAARWRRIGRAVFADEPDAVVSMHPCGVNWPVEQFIDEPWYAFVGIQSGHGADEQSLRFLQTGPYASRWRRIHKPFVNLEPNYETASAYGTDIVFDDFHVRRAAYWSMLVAPPAGVTHGSNPIWIWAQRDGEEAEGHGPHWVTRAWRQGLNTPGIDSMTHMKAFFEQLPWTQLRPAPEVLSSQPGDADAQRFIAAASTPCGSTIVAYSPMGEPVALRLHSAGPTDRTYWLVDPRSNDWRRWEAMAQGQTHVLTPPDDRDWLFVVC